MDPLCVDSLFYLTTVPPPIFILSHTLSSKEKAAVKGLT